MDAKQVIVMRKDLNMRKGKMIAQGAHASIAFLCDYGKYVAENEMHTPLTDAAVEWIHNGFTKICVGVDSEEELLAIADKAQVANLTVRVIVDKGLTEFDGVPTITCLAVGPDWSDEINKVTGELKLL